MQKTNKMQTIDIDVFFLEEKDERKFYSLSKKQKKEFTTDLVEMINKLRPEMEMAQVYTARVISNQRLSNERLFSFIAWFNLTPNKTPEIVIQEFTELQTRRIFRPNKLSKKS